MKDPRIKDILLAAGCIFGIQLLNWPVAYYSTVNTDWAGVILLFAYWLLIVPAYFVTRRFSRQKGLFWVVALGCHILLSVLSRLAMDALFEKKIISGWDTWNYAISWFLVVAVTDAVLLLDLLILGIKKLVTKRQKAKLFK